MSEIEVIYDGPIVKRSDAKAIGLKYYFTGNPCIKGHVDKRQTSNGICHSCRVEKNREYMRALAISDPERVRATNAIASTTYRKVNKEKVRIIHANVRARRRNAEGYYTAGDIAAIYSRQSGLCVYCDAALSEGYHVDHIMPLHLGGSNWPDNLQCLCPTCNVRKGAKHPDYWHKEIGWAV